MNDSARNGIWLVPLLLWSMLVHFFAAYGLLAFAGWWRSV